MKRLSYITIFSCIIMTLLLSACRDKDTKSKLILENKSSEIISDIVIKRVDKTNIMGTYLKSNQHCYFDMGIQQNCTYKVEFEDKNNKITRSEEFTSDFNKGETVDINILKGNNGEWSIIIYN